MDLKYMRNGMVSSATNFTLNSFQLLNDLNPAFRQVVSSVSDDRVMTYYCEAPANAPYELSITLPPIVFVVDFSWLKHMLSFFKRDEPRLKEEVHLVPATRAEIQKAIENHVRVNMNITIELLQLRFVYAEIPDQPSLDLMLKGISIISKAPGVMSLTDFSTCFTLYEVCADSAEFALENRTVSDEFSGKIKFYQAIAATDLFPSKKVFIELSRGTLNLETSEIHLVKQILLYFMDNYIEVFSTSGWTTLLTAEFKLSRLVLNVFYEHKKLLDFIVNDFELVAAIDMVIDVRITGKALHSTEYFGYFPTLLAESTPITDVISLHVNFSDERRVVTFDAGKFVLFGQEAPINFIVNFFRFMEDYEVRLGWKDSPPARNVVHESSTTGADIEIEMISKDFTMHIGELALLNAPDFRIVFVYKAFGYDLLMQIHKASITTDQLGTWNSVLELDEAQIDFHTFSVFVRLHSGRIVVYYTWFMDLTRYFLRLIHYGKDEIEAPNGMIYSDVVFEAEHVDVVLLPCVGSSHFTISSPQINYNMSKVPEESKLSLTDTSITYNGNHWLQANSLTVHIVLELAKYDEGALFKAFIDKKTDLKAWTEETSEYLSQEHPDTERIKVLLWIIGTRMSVEFDGLSLTYTHASASSFKKWVSSIFEEVKPAEAYSMNFDFKVEFDDSDIQLLDGDRVLIAHLSLQKFEYFIDRESQQITFGSVSLIPCCGCTESITGSNSPDIPFALCRFVGREFSVTLGNDSFFIHHKATLPILNYLMMCPLLGEPDDLLPDNYVPITLVVNADGLTFTLPTKQGAPDLTLTGGISMSWGEKSFWFHAINMCLSYDSGASPIVNPFSCEIKKQIVDGEIRGSVYLTDMSVFLSPSDIVLIMKVFNTFKKKMNKAVVEDRSSLLEADTISFKACFMPIEVTLCHSHSPGHQFPFMKWRVEPVEFNLNRRLGSTNSFFEVSQGLFMKSYTTGNWDALVENFQIVATYSSVNDYAIAELQIGKEITVNLTSIFLKEMLEFEYRLKQLSSQDVAGDVTSVVIANCMGTKIRIHFTNRTIDLENDERFSVPLLNDDIPIGVSYTPDLSHGDCSFRPKDIMYPLYISHSCVVFSEASHGCRLLTISSPFQIENKTSTNIEVLIQKGDNLLKAGKLTSLGIAQGHKTFYIPPPIKLKGYTFVFRGENSPEVENPKRFAHRKFDQPSRSYTIPTMKGNICCKIRETLDKKRLIGKLTIVPSLTLFNECPVDLDVNFVGEDFFVHVCAGENLDIPYIPTHNLRIACAIRPPGFEYSNTKHLSLHGNTSKPKRFAMTASDGSRFIRLAAVTDHVLDRAQASIYFYSPVSIFTKFPVPVVVRAPEEENFIFKFQKQDGDMMMYSSNKYFKSGKVMAQLACPGISEWSRTAIDCTASGISDVLFLPHVDNPAIYVPVRHVVTNPSSPYIHASVLTLFPALSVVNELDRDFLLWPQKMKVQSPDIMKPGVKSHVFLANKDFSYTFYIDGYNPCDELVLSAPVKTVFRVFNNYENLFIEMEVVEDGYSLCAHFRKPRFPSPVVICNYLDGIEFSVYQLYDSSKILCPPQTTTAFAFDAPFGEQGLVIDIHDKKIGISLDEDLEATHLVETRHMLEIRTVGEGIRMVLVSETPYIVSRHCRGMGLLIKGISVSFVDDKWHEVLVASVGEIALHIDTSEKYHMIDFTIESFQVDDQCPIAPLPVSIIGSPTPAHKFLRFSAVSNRDAPFFTSFKYFSLLIQRIQVFGDLAFISDTISYFHDVLKAVPTAPAILGPPSAKQECKSVGRVYYFKNLQIHPILLVFSLRTVTGRPYLQPTLPDLPITKIRLFGNITEVPIMLNCMVIKNFHASFGYLKRMFIDQYKNSLMNQMWAIAGHADILLNPIGVFRSFGSGFDSFYYDPEEGDLQDPHNAANEKEDTKSRRVSSPRPVGSVLSPGEGFLRSISTIMSVASLGQRHVTTGGINKTAGETVKEGFVALGAGFADGFSGLVMEPIQGGKKAGVKGVFKGIGKGLVGVVVKPTVGIIDMGAGIAGGIHKLAGPGGVTFDRRRIPHAYPMATIDSFDETAASIQLGVQTSTLLTGIVDDILIAYINEPENATVFGLFQKRFVILKKPNLATEKSHTLSHLIEPRVTRNVFTFYTRNAVSRARQFHTYVCPSDEYAEKILAMIVSQKLSYDALK